LLFYEGLEEVLQEYLLQQYLLQIALRVYPKAYFVSDQ